MPKKKRSRASRSSRRASRRRLGWRGVQLSNKFQRRLRIFAMAVAVVVSTVSVFALLAFWQVLRAPLVKASDESISTPGFSQSRRYNVLLLTLEDKNDAASQIESISILSVDPVNGTLSVISVPSNTDISNTNEYGDIKISSLYALGAVDHQDGGTGISFVAKVIENKFAVPIEKYVVTDKQGIDEFSILLGGELTWDNFDHIFSIQHLPRLLEVISSVRDYVWTDFSVHEGIRILRFVLRVRSDRLSKLELSRSDLEDTRVLDRKLQKFVADSKVFEDRLSVQVLNGTTTPGLASIGSRFVENLGGRVVGIGNTTEQNAEKSYILARNTDSYTVKRLSEVFGIKVVREYTSAYGIKERADISVVFGLDSVGEL